MGTPPINVFDGCVKEGKLYIGGDCVLDVSGTPDGEVYVGIRPEGFIPCDDGKLCCHLSGVEVMGRDISVVSTHECAETAAIRSIISAETRLTLGSDTVRFDLKPAKVFLFGKADQQRILF